MAGKNTSVLGIYSNYSTVERAVDTLKDAGSATRTSPCCFRPTSAVRTSRT